MDARRFVHFKSQNAFGVLGLLKFSQEQTDLTVCSRGRVERCCKEASIGVG